MSDIVDVTLVSAASVAALLALVSLLGRLRKSSCQSELIDGRNGPVSS